MQITAFFVSNAKCDKTLWHLNANTNEYVSSKKLFIGNNMISKSTDECDAVIENPMS